MTSEEVTTIDMYYTMTSKSLGITYFLYGSVTVFEITARDFSIPSEKVTIVDMCYVKTSKLLGIIYFLYGFLTIPAITTKAFSIPSTSLSSSSISVKLSLLELETLVYTHIISLGPLSTRQLRGM